MSLYYLFFLHLFCALYYIGSSSKYTFHKDLLLLYATKI